MKGHANQRGAHLHLLRRLFVAAFLNLGLSSRILAQVSGTFPNTLPSATIISDETDATPVPESSVGEDVPAPVPTPARSHSSARHHSSVSAPTYSAAVEPTHAMLKLRKDAWAYAGPATASGTVERVRAGKFLNVTGSTHYYVQVKLKNGSTGYVPLSAVELTRPEDKIMRLSTDAGVLSQPNRYGKNVSEVHQGHDVHVIGVSMNYIKIRMKNRLEGYIPLTAAE